MVVMDQELSAYNSLKCNDIAKNFITLIWKMLEYKRQQLLPSREKSSLTRNDINLIDLKYELNDNHPIFVLMSYYIKLAYRIITMRTGDDMKYIQEDSYGIISAFCEIERLIQKMEFKYSSEFTPAVVEEISGSLCLGRQSVMPKTTFSELMHELRQIMLARLLKARILLQDSTDLHVVTRKQNLFWTDSLIHMLAVNHNSELKEIYREQFKDFELTANSDSMSPRMLDTICLDTTHKRLRRAFNKKGNATCI